jgi:hypothetical protein
MRNKETWFLWKMNNPSSTNDNNHQLNLTKTTKSPPKLPREHKQEQNQKGVTDSMRRQQLFEATPKKMNNSQHKPHQILRLQTTNHPR